ncbi:MAG TPA: 2-oxoglutarate dehydrogenase E1 component [Herbaspirillum sp.]|jgi:2-oxoglutarate dehydrogenase E1 component
MMNENRASSFLYGANAPYIEEQYELYLGDAAAVPAEWRHYFDALRKLPAADGTDHDDVAHAPVIDHFVALARGPRSAAGNPEDVLRFARKQAAVEALIAAYRMVGARKARIDPLQWTPTAQIPDLAPGMYGLAKTDMATAFSAAGTGFAESDLALGDLIAALEQTYCGTLAAEFMHLSDSVQRQWWAIRLESGRAAFPVAPEQQQRMLERLTAAEGLEKYLHARYVGQKRFSLEGGESLIVLLDELIRHGASQGIRSVVMGMAHRGRLNVLVNVIGKPPHALFDEFDGKTAHTLPAGDVKYHKGFNGVAQTDAGEVELILASNPSHLEIVNPVVQGISRARSDQLGVDGAVLPVEIHGDVAISGQGIVMETMNLSATRGHGTGGTIHIVVNNQVGFTTSDPRDTRSTFFCTDIAKMIEAPVLHVNGDDPEAVAAAVRLALDYRTAFKKSVMIDLVCFRRHGHQEQDTPNITQPMMYRAIAANPGVRKIYAQKLVDSGIVSAEQAESLIHAYRDRLESTQQQAQSEAQAEAQRERREDAAMASRSYAPPSLPQLRELAGSISEIPGAYSLHPLVAKVIAGRREMAAGARPLDWGMGEHLAFASLLAAGIDVRLSGQDSERGTFTHRHAVLHNQNRENRSEGVYVPLQHVGAAQGKFAVTNSLLSEAAVLGFEYGYSITRPDALVMWEAQFGDFANGAQVVIDQFIAAGAAKWGQYSGLTMLLPHGQEGQGPEHASARLERYLQLCAQNNIQVCQPTTPAQMFHLLRRQVLLRERRPLIVMTPKSLLRHAQAVSSLEELAAGGFQAVLGDAGIGTAESKTIRRAVLASGKVYYDLLVQRQEQRKSGGRDDVALIRLEQLYPFPAEQLAAELARYPELDTVVWCQEEPHNQGAWKMIEPSLRAIVPSSARLQYAGRDELASTAPGYFSVHAEQQKNLVQSAFTK